MKASESVDNYPARLREYANFAVRGVKKICKAYGPREPGSDSELNAQKAMEEELKTCCDSTSIEDFPVQPRAFLGWVPVCAVSMMISAVLCFFGIYIVSLILTSICFIFAITEFLFYKKYFDFLFPKKTSHNVIGIRKPSGEVKKRIIFSGHCDSAYEWNYTYLGGPKLLVTVIAFNFASFIVAFICSIGGVATGHIFLDKAVDSTFLTIAGYVFLAWIPILISGFFFCNFRKPVMGANDNLTGCFISMAVAKYLADNNIRFENTEIRIVLTGSEEAGLRGAKAYADAHKEDLGEVETAFVGLDTIRDFEFMAIYNRDMTGTVKNDPKLCALLQQAGKNAGYALPLKSVFFGASDAAAISQAGFSAATFAAMDPAPARYYHTRLDTEDNLEPSTIEASVSIALETAFLFDEQGLN